MSRKTFKCFFLIIICNYHYNRKHDPHENCNHTVLFKVIKIVEQALTLVPTTEATGNEVWD